MGYLTTSTISFFDKDTKQSVSIEQENKIASFMYFLNLKSNQKARNRDKDTGPWFPFNFNVEENEPMYDEKTGKIYIEQHCEFVTYTTESVKWYDKDSHMIELSKMFPTVVFSLYVEGEETGDISKAYYLNGRKHKAKVKIDIEDFSETALAK